MSQRRVASAIILLLLAVLLPIRFAENAAATGLPDVIQPSSIAMANLVTHGDGSMTVTDCKNMTPLNNSSTTYAAITMDPGGNVINQVPKDIDGWLAKSCLETSVAGTDNTFFVMQSKNYWMYHRLVAYKNGAARWTQTYECSGGQDLNAQAMTLGSDGNIYAVFYNPGYTCSELPSGERMLIGINAHDGSEIFREVFSVEESWNDIWLFAQANRLIVKTAKELLFFGQSDGTPYSAQTVLVGSANERFMYYLGLNDDDTLVYARTNPNATPPVSCSSYSGRQSMHIKQGTGAEANLSLPDCEAIRDIEVLPSDDIVYLYQHLGTGEWRLKRRDIAGNVLFDVVVSSLSGYSVFMDAVASSDAVTIANNGTIYLKRRVYQNPGDYNDFNLRIDTVSSTGSVSLVFSTSEFNNPSAQEYYTALGAFTGGLAGDKLYLPYCNGNSCSAYSAGKIAVVDLATGFDYPRSSTFAGHEQLNYVALGDSFSSGEGVEPFYEATDVSPDVNPVDPNMCHRSKKAYPEVLSNTPGSRLNLTDFVACSGATVQGITTNGQWDEDKQIDAPDENTDVVTVTIGGNDIGFSAFATACTLGACGMNSPIYEDTIDAIYDPDFQDELFELYKDIVDATANTTQVYVVGYPYLTPEIGPTNSVCWPFNEAANNPDPETGDAAAAYAVVEALNDVIRTAANNVEVSQYAENVHYVDPNTSGSPFGGHDWCSQDSYFGIVELDDLVRSFHPTADGHVAYAGLIRQHI